MKFLLLPIASLALALIALKFHLPLLGLPAVFGCIFGMVYFLHQERRAALASMAKVTASDGQLRTQLAATHILALNSLGCAEESLKTLVVSLLIEAGRHLGEPVTNGRRVYSTEYLIIWNNEGLALVAQARKLIDDYAAAAPK
jgi:hypothetical protein